MPYRDPAQRRAQSKRWYWENREKILELRKHHHLNKDLAISRRDRKRIAERQPAYRSKVKANRQANPEISRQATRKWEKAHPIQRKAIVKSWYRRNRTRILAQRKQYYQENKHRLKQAQPEARRRHTLAVYGITPEQFSAMLTAQGGRCAICRSDKPFGKNFHLDHCHVTGRVRGILCKRCNNGIGFFDDDISKMKLAMEYLAKGE